MNTTADSSYDRVRAIQDEIGVLLRKRFVERKPFKEGDFPASDEERQAWQQFTAPENVEALIEINASLHADDEFSIALWKSALKECRRRAVKAIPGLVAGH